MKGSNYITFRDIQSGRLPNGNIDKDIVELMAKENPVLQDVLWKECSKGREDITTIRTGMPTATLRMFYEGVAGSKSAKKQVSNSCCTVSTALTFDWRLYQQTKDKAAFLADEQKAHADVVGQGIAGLLFYGNTDEDPKGINGFARTYCEYAKEGFADDKKAQFYVLNGGHKTVKTAESALRSVYLVGWGVKSVHGLYPEDSQMGIRIGTLTNQYMDDGAGKNLSVGIQEMNWDAGLAIRDFRYSGRIANIDIARAFDTADVPDYTEKIRRLVCRVKGEGVSQRLYMCRQMFEVLSTQFGRKTQENAIRYPDLLQKLDASILGIPVSFNDALNVDEEEVPQMV